MKKRDRAKINSINATKARGGIGGAFWTTDRIDIIKNMWAAEDSASVIAAVIGSGCTRNMVIGKAHRLGHAARDKNSRVIAA